MPLKCTCLAVSLFLFTSLSFAQDLSKVSMSDYIKIRSSAEELIATNLKDLMNSVASKELDKSAIQQIITNSCSGTYNRVFDSTSVIIEDDVDPAATVGKAVDKKVDEYLRDLDLFYTKSENQSIVLTISRFSGLKRSGRYYLKVYFTSFFRNKNLTIDTPYSINNRVAEIYAHKTKGGWTTSIGRIAFYVPADTVNDIINDVALEMDSSQQAMALGEQKTFEQKLRDQERKEQVERMQKLDKDFDALIMEGDKALATRNYQLALKKYGDAKNLKPYEKLVFAKIHDVRTQNESAKMNDEIAFDKYIVKARAAFIKHDYKTAIETYMAAKDLDPVQGAKYDQTVNDLKVKFANVDKLEEMAKAGKCKDAIGEYSSLIKKNKTYSDYYLGRGKCYDKTGETSRALKDYTEAYNLDKDNIEALIQRADLNKRLGKYIDAIADYKSYLLNYKNNPVAYLEMSNLRILNNYQFEEAIAILDEGLKQPALVKEPELYFKRGELKMKKNDWKNAIEDFSAAIELNPTHALALYDRGTSYLMLNQVTNAAADFEGARTNKVDSVFINDIAGFAVKRFDRADAKYTQKSTDSAIILVNDAIAIDPKNEKYRYNKGEYYFSLQKYPEAIKCYDETIEIYAKHTNAWYKRGLSYHLLDSNNTAIKSFTKALQIYPQYALAQKGIGDAQFTLKEYESAAVAYESCLTTLNATKSNDNSLYAEVFNGLGKSYYHIQNYEKSLAALKSAIRKNESFAEAYFNRGLSSYRSGKLDDAIEDFNKALSLNAADNSWKYYQAHAYQNNNQFEIAIDHYRELLSSDTKHEFPDAIYLQGKSYYSLKQYQPALANYLSTLNQQQDTSIASFNYELGNIYLNIGKYDSALVFFNKAAVKDAANGLVNYGIASSQLLKGNRDEAMIWFEKAFATHQPSEKEVKRDPLIKAILNEKKFKDLLKKYY